MESATLSNVERAFADAFASFQRSAFRLEWLQTYKVEEEQLLFQAFLKEGAAKSCPRGFEEWGNDIQKAIATGKSYQRVRRVTQPLTDYTRFEILNGYRFSVQAGEHVRILENPNHIFNFARDFAEVKDFWLFDENLCFELEYGKHGGFIRLHSIEHDRVPFYVTAKKKLLALSVELKESKAWELAWMPQAH